MGKWANDNVMDAALAYVDDCDRLFVCSSTNAPANYTEASSTYCLATATLTPGAGNGSFTLGNGDASGRKLSVAQQSNKSITASGTAKHIALGISGSSTLVEVTTCTDQPLTSGGTVTIPTWDIEIADPS